MADTTSTDPPKKRFAPKEPVNLNPPKTDPISIADLAQCDGTDTGKPVYVAIKGTVFDVSGNSAYAPKGGYHGKFFLSILYCLFTVICFAVVL